jgi:sulfatase maturation enzyme AslB (radical SAM superfamily)
LEIVYDTHPRNTPEQITDTSDYDLLEHFLDESKDTIIINWWMGNICNYKCSYCPEYYHNGSDKWMNYEAAKSFCDKVLNHYRGKTILFEFLGGEITLWKDFLRLVRYLKENHAYVSMISNGTQTIQWWDENVDLFNIVYLSYHAEFANSMHFLSILNTIKNKLMVNVNIMMHPSWFSACLKTAREIIKIGNISVVLQPLIVDLHGNQLYHYTRMQLRIIQAHANFIQQIHWSKKFRYFRSGMKKVNTKSGTMEPVFSHTLISQNENSWKGWYCYAGVEQIAIEPNGDFFRGRCKVGGKIGNVYDQELSFAKTPVICSKDKCNCNFDITCTKKRVII